MTHDDHHGHKAGGAHSGHGGSHHGHAHDAHGSGSAPSRARRGLHRDWRLWIVVALMLGALLIYVLTMDEALAPVG